MIGNDLVDLSLAKHAHRWERKGFLEKIFTENELHLVQSGPDLFTSLWWLWSQKEAVYKIVNRSSGRRWFNPHAFQVTGFGAESTVLFGTNQYCVRTYQQRDKIESIATDYRADFKCVRPVDLNCIVKLNELPFFKDYSGKLQPATVSHHGKYASAYALLNA